MKKIHLNELIVEVIQMYLILRKKLDIPDTNYLLLNLNGRSGLPLTKNALTKTLNRIFDGKISVSMLRKSYLSEKYPVSHTRTEMENDAYIMGHSVNTQQTIYRKKD
jgi:hypothetical protein